jgi:DNA invertase Pin-like site-specific DNA recombinase
MIAAIYARKSHDQHEAKSVTRQIEHATAYATAKGWTVDEHHIYVDDGITGAEFAKRPGFVRLMNALKPRPPFQALVMSEESRLGREMIERSYALKQIVTAGVRVFYYLDDKERTLDSPTDKVLLAVNAYAGELEREMARQRSRDAARQRATASSPAGPASATETCGPAVATSSAKSIRRKPPSSCASSRCVATAKGRAGSRRS